MREVRTRVNEEVPALDISLALLMEDLIGDLTAVPQPVEVIIYGNDLASLQDAGRRVADALTKVPGLVSIEDGIVIAGDALTITVDRELAHLEKLDPTVISTVVGDLTTGAIPTQITNGVDVYNVRVRLPEKNARATIEDISEIKLRNADGALVPLNRVATVERVSGQAQITRENMQRMVAVTARIEGRDIGSTVADVVAMLHADAMLVPAPLRWELGGLYREQQESFRGMLIVFGAGIVLVFTLVLILYERLTVALTILLVPACGAVRCVLGTLAHRSRTQHLSTDGAYYDSSVSLPRCQFSIFPSTGPSSPNGVEHRDALLRAEPGPVSPNTDDDSRGDTGASCLSPSPWDRARLCNNRSPWRLSPGWSSRCRWYSYCYPAIFDMLTGLADRHKHTTSGTGK